MKQQFPSLSYILNESDLVNDLTKLHDLIINEVDADIRFWRSSLILLYTYYTPTVKIDGVLLNLFNPSARSIHAWSTRSPAMCINLNNIDSTGMDTRGWTDGMIDGASTNNLIEYARDVWGIEDDNIINKLVYNLNVARHQMGCTDNHVSLFIRAILKMGLLRNSMHHKTYSDLMGMQRSDVICQFDQPFYDDEYVSERPINHITHKSVFTDNTMFGKTNDITVNDCMTIECVIDNTMKFNFDFAEHQHVIGLPNTTKNELWYISYMFGKLPEDCYKLGGIWATMLHPDINVNYTLLSYNVHKNRPFAPNLYNAYSVLIKFIQTYHLEEQFEEVVSIVLQCLMWPVPETAEAYSLYYQKIIINLNKTISIRTRLPISYNIIIDDYQFINIWNEIVIGSILINTASMISIDSIANLMVDHISVSNSVDCFKKYMEKIKKVSESKLKIGTMSGMHKLDGIISFSDMWARLSNVNLNGTYGYVHFYDLDLMLPVPIRKNACLKYDDTTGISECSRYDKHGEPPTIYTKKFI